MTEGSSQQTAAPPAKSPKLTGIPLLVVALGVVLFVQALFVFSYIGALHKPTPHGVRFGVVGAAAPVAAAVGKQFSLKTTTYTSQAAVLHAVDHRTIDGGLVAGPKGLTLIVAPAAGPAEANALGTAFGAAAAALKQPLEVVQVHTLPRDDAGGITPFLLAMTLVVGGYLSATIALAFGGQQTRHGRLTGLAIAAVAGALLTDVLAGPVIGAVPTGKFFVLWGLFTLVMMAVAFATAGLQALLGAPGTLIVIIAFVIFGAPASGGTLPAPFLPGFWRAIGPYLPAGAGTTAVRNTLYFDGNAIARAVIVLLAYLVLGAVAVLVVRRRQVSPAAGEAEAEAAAASAVIV